MMVSGAKWSAQFARLDNSPKQPSFTSCSASSVNLFLNSFVPLFSNILSNSSFSNNGFPSGLAEKIARRSSAVLMGASRCQMAWKTSSVVASSLEGCSSWIRRRRDWGPEVLTGNELGWLNITARGARMGVAKKAREGSRS